jgi:hypothetical protein
MLFAKKVKGIGEKLKNSQYPLHPEEDSTFTFFFSFPLGC